MREAINSFKQRIKVGEDTERIRLLRLQEDFSKGYITEEEISEEDVEKLHKLYDEQIEELNKSTENYRRKILEIRKKLNKNV